MGIRGPTPGGNGQRMFRRELSARAARAAVASPQAALAGAAPIVQGFPYTAPYKDLTQKT